MATDPAAVPRIHKDSIYLPEQLRRVLGLKPNTLGREVRLGRLRVAKRGGRYYIIGQWALDWLKQGEVSRGQKPGANGAADAANGQA